VCFIESIISLEVDTVNVENVSLLFTVAEYGKMQTQFFSALGPETEEQMKLAKDNIRFDLYR